MIAMYSPNTDGGFATSPLRCGRRQHRECERSASPERERKRQKQRGMRGRMRGSDLDLRQRRQRDRDRRVDDERVEANDPLPHASGSTHDSK